MYRLGGLYVSDGLAKTYKTAKSTLRSIRLSIFTGQKAYIEHVEVLGKCRRADFLRRYYVRLYQVPPTRTGIKPGLSKKRTYKAPITVIHARFVRLITKGDRDPLVDIRQKVGNGIMGVPISWPHIRPTLTDGLLESSKYLLIDFIPWVFE